MGRVLLSRRDKCHHSRYLGSHYSATHTPAHSELGSVIRTLGSYLYSISKPGMTWGIYLVDDLLYLIAFPALYFALRQANRTVTLIAAIFNMVFVAVDVGIDIPLRLSLIGLSNSYGSSNGVRELHIWRQDS